MSNTIQKRSFLHFGVFVIFALGATIFVVNKATQAIAEIRGLNENKFVIIRSKRIDTSHWETYQDEKLGIEFKYPVPEWRVKDAIGGPLSIINSEEDDATHILVWVDDPQLIKQRHGLVIKSLNDARKNLDKIAVGDLTINGVESFGGLPAVKYYATLGGSWHEQYMVWHRDMLYTLAYPIDAKTKVALEPFILKILATFKFIK